jgi:hypothetical protein
MPTICIQCALEAFVAGTTDMATAARFEETPEAHQRRVHPDLAATRARRRVLEDLAAKKMGGQMIRPDEN